MITKEEAREIAYREITSTPYPKPDDLELAIIDASTQEYEFGWVFFYTSKLYLETNDIQYMMAGNAPVIVNKNDGSIYVTGTARITEYYVEEYRRKLNPELYCPLWKRLLDKFTGKAKLPR